MAKKIKFKKFYLDPIYLFLVLSIVLIFITSVLYAFKFNTNYKIMDAISKETKIVPVYINNLLTRETFNDVFINSIKNLLSYKYFYYVLVSFISLAFLSASGFLDVLFKKCSNMKSSTITYILVLLSMITKVFGDFPMVFLIPFAALLYKSNKKNPILGIITVYASVTFTYGINLIFGIYQYNISEIAYATMNFIEEGSYLPFTSIMFVSIVTIILLSFIMTYIIENLVVKIIPKYKEKEEIEEIKKEITIDNKAYFISIISGIVVFLSFIYCLIPKLPYSGLLLDHNMPKYIDKVFSSNSVVIDGMIFYVLFISIVMSIVYILNAKIYKNINEFTNNVFLEFQHFGKVVITMFFFIIFIKLYEISNIGLFITSFLSNLLDKEGFTSIALIVLSIFVISLSGIFLPSFTEKWKILSAVLIPKFNLSSMTAGYATFLFTTSDAMFKAISPFFGGFVIYLVFLNIYNTNETPIGIKKAISLLKPILIIVVITLIAITIFTYILGLPIGPNMKPII